PRRALQARGGRVRPGLSIQETRGDDEAQGSDLRRERSARAHARHDHCRAERVESHPAAMSALPKQGSGVAGDAKQAAAEVLAGRPGPASRRWLGITALVVFVLFAIDTFLVVQ